MEKELQALIDRSKEVNLSEAQLEEGRVAIAAANGGISDSRITLQTMQATRTVMLASEQPKER